VDDILVADKVDTEALFRRLQAVEGDQAEQDKLFERLQQQGASMIATVDFDEPDTDRKLQVLEYLRALFALRVWDDNVRLVKSDGSRFFVFAKSAGEALEAAFLMRKLLVSFHTWVGDFLSDGAQGSGSVGCSPCCRASRRNGRNRGALPKAATLKAGIHHGSILLIEEDCYGTPVNVASKIGEDLALPGEIMVSASSAQNAEDARLQSLLSSLVLEPKQTEISGVSLDYCQVTAKISIEDGDAVAMPATAEVEEFLRGTGSSDLVVSELVIMTTDMSGFTRLSKQYGILHFLRLVFKARAIILPALQNHGGWKIKYEGDNIIAAFPGVDDAIACIHAVVEQVREYNVTREKDFQIRMGFGVDVGQVHCSGHDIFGSAFDCSFKLAEDIAEVGEVLVTERVKAAGWPTVPGCKLSDGKLLEEGNVKFFALTFPA